MSAPAGIDETPLDRLREAGGVEFERKIVRLFLEHVPVRLESARGAAASGDADGVRFHAHSLKSSAAQLGAIRMSELCKEAERRGAEGDVAASVLDEVKVELDSVCAWFRAKLE